MARGWESKAVAEQMDQADVRATEKETPYDVSPAVRARRERLESLRLSRARTVEQLARASNPTRREMLERTLRALDMEMKNLA